MFVQIYVRLITFNLTIADNAFNLDVEDYEGISHTLETDKQQITQFLTDIHK